MQIFALAFDTVTNYISCNDTSHRRSSTARIHVCQIFANFSCFVCVSQSSVSEQFAHTRAGTDTHTHTRHSVLSFFFAGIRYTTVNSVYNHMFLRSLSDFGKNFHFAADRNEYK